MDSSHRKVFTLQYRMQHMTVWCCIICCVNVSVCMCVQASFSVSENRTDIDINDPNFWQKWAKKADIDVDSINSKVGSTYLSSLFPLLLVMIRRVSVISFYLEPCLSAWQWVFAVLRHLAAAASVKQHGVQPTGCMDNEPEPFCGVSWNTDQFRLDYFQSCAPGRRCYRVSSVYHLALEKCSGIS